MLTNTQEEKVILKGLTAIVKRLLSITDGEMTAIVHDHPFRSLTLRYKSHCLIDDDLATLHNISNDIGDKPQISCIVRPDGDKLQVDVGMLFDEKEWDVVVNSTSAEVKHMSMCRNCAKWKPMSGDDANDKLGNCSDEHVSFMNKLDKNRMADFDEKVVYWNTGGGPVYFLTGANFGCVYFESKTGM